MSAPGFHGFAVAVPLAAFNGDALGYQSRLDWVVANVGMMVLVSLVSQQRPVHRGFEPKVTAAIQLKERSIAQPLPDEMAGKDWSSYPGKSPGIEARPFLMNCSGIRPRGPHGPAADAVLI